MLGLAVMLAMAQGLPAGGCALADAHATSGAAPLLYVSCGGATAVLGTADRYASSYNATLDATLVTRDVGSATVVMLVTRRPDGTLQIDDVSRELATLATGSKVARPLLVVDLSSFAATGMISATANGGTATNLDLAPYAARVKALAVAAASATTVPDVP